MSRVAAVAAPEVHRGTLPFPPHLGRMFGDSGQSHISWIGNRALFEVPWTALFTSVSTPPDLVLRGLRLGRELRDDGVVIAAGFQTLFERDLLTVLLRGDQAVIICPARSVAEFRIPATLGQSLEAGRVLIVSPFGPRMVRPTAALAMTRNRFVVSLAPRVLVVSARPGSRTFRTAQQALDQGREVACLDHPDNMELLMLGARPLERRLAPTTDVSGSRAARQEERERNLCRE